MKKKNYIIVGLVGVVIAVFGILDGLARALNGPHYFLATLLWLFFLAVFILTIDFHNIEEEPLNLSPYDLAGLSPAGKDALKQAEDKKRSQKPVRIMTACVMAASLLVLTLLFAIPPTHDYIISAYYMTETPTATQTATPTATPPPTSTPLPSATLAPTPTAMEALTATPVPCFCQQSSDDQTIQCLIVKESEAANKGAAEGLALIGQIFAPNATIFRGDQNFTWYDPLSYYGPSFAAAKFTNANHPMIVQKKISSTQAFYVSSSKGIYTLLDGKTGTYDNPIPSEHWVLAKNGAGCWAVTYYAFNAAHITPFPPESP